MAKSNSSCSVTSAEYLAFQACYEEIIGGVKADPGSLCDTLFSRGLITESARDYNRNDSKLDLKKAQKLVDNVIDRIKINPIVFHDFVELLKSPHNNDLVKTLEDCYQAKKSIEDNFIAEPPPSRSFQLQEIEHSLGELSLLTEDQSLSSQTDAFGTKQTAVNTFFICPYCTKCTLERYLCDEGCPKASNMTLFPYLDTQDLSKEDQMVLEGTLVCATRDLRTLFAHTDTTIAQNLHAEVTAVKNFAVDLVRDLGQEENELAIVKANTIPEIILALRPYKSFLNYGIIENIVNEFGSPENHAVMQKYVTAFKDFCKRSAFKLPINVLSKKSKVRKEGILTVKLTKKGHASLLDVVDAQERIATILGVKYWALKICSIEEGCVCVRFLVPASIMSKILPLSSVQNSVLEDAELQIFMREEDAQFFTRLDRPDHEEIVNSIQLSSDDLTKSTPPIPKKRSIIKPLKSESSGRSQGLNPVPKKRSSVAKSMLASSLINNKPVPKKRSTQSSSSSSSQSLVTELISSKIDSPPALQETCSISSKSINKQAAAVSSNQPVPKKRLHTSIAPESPVHPVPKKRQLLKSLSSANILPEKSDSVNPIPKRRKVHKLLTSQTEPDELPSNTCHPFPKKRKLLRQKSSFENTIDHESEASLANRPVPKKRIPKCIAQKFLHTIGIDDSSLNTNRPVPKNRRFVKQKSFPSENTSRVDESSQNTSHSSPKLFKQQSLPLGNTLDN